MSVKYFCDRCRSEMRKPDHERLKVRLGEFGVEVMQIVRGTYNAGHLCHKCVREIVAKGKPK